MWLGAMAFVFLAASVAVADAGEERVRADLERFLRARVGSGEVSIQFPPLTSFAFDRNRHPGDLRTQLTTRAETPLRGRVPVTVELYAGAELVSRGVISPNIQVSERVVVPTRDLKRGEVLTTEDLRYAERDAARLQSDVVREIDLVLGQRMRRSVRAGRPFRLSQIESVPLVERGDRVMILLESGSLKIQAIGRAQEAGAIGEWIRVLNVDSKREISGRVDHQGAVHVAF
jgi:flagella basal body P-ring formation protein FlgA